MHLHARRANYIGPDPMPMCAPFAVMPRSDPKESVRDLVFNVDPPCENPIPAATTDEQVMRDTIAVMEKHNIIGMVSGEPELMKTWRRWKGMNQERRKAGRRVSNSKAGKPGRERRQVATTNDQNSALFLLSSFPDLNPFWISVSEFNSRVRASGDRGGRGMAIASCSARIR